MTMKLLLLLLLATQPLMASRQDDTQAANKVPPPPAGYGGKIVYDATSNRLLLQEVPQKPREVIVTKIELGPTFYDPGQNTVIPAAGTVANDYKTGYFVLAKTITSPVIHYKLACPWAPVEVGATYFITQSSRQGEVRRVVFTDKEGKPSAMICFVDLEMKADHD